MNDKNISMPLLGDAFPRIGVRTTKGNLTLPKDYKGNWFILFSHPSDFTPICTTEFFAFAKLNKQFEKLNTKLIGLSVDPIESHLEWVDWINKKLKVIIPYPIIADEDNLTANKLGMIHKNKGLNTVRAVFIVDPKGILRLTMYYPQEVGRSINEVLRALEALQISDANNVLMPENYPNNSFLKDKVVVPIAKSKKEALKSLKTNKNLESKDWWFIYKNLPSKKQ